MKLTELAAGVQAGIEAKQHNGATAQHELPVGGKVVATIDAPWASVAGLSVGQRFVAYDQLAQWNLRQPPDKRLTLQEAEIVRKVLFHDGPAGCAIGERRLRGETFGSSNSHKSQAKANLIEKGFLIASSGSRRKAQALRVALPKVCIDNALAYFPSVPVHRAHSVSLYTGHTQCARTPGTQPIKNHEKNHQEAAASIEAAAQRRVNGGGGDRKATKVADADWHRMIAKFHAEHPDATDYLKWAREEMNTRQWPALEKGWRRWQANRAAG